MYPVKSKKQIKYSFNGYETWLLKIGDIWKLLVFNHRCSQTTIRIFWNHRVNSPEIRPTVLDKYGKSTEEVVNIYRLKWLGHVLHVPINRSPTSTHDVIWCRSRLEEC